MDQLVLNTKKWLLAAAGFLLLAYAGFSVLERHWMLSELEAAGVSKPRWRSTLYREGLLEYLPEAARGPWDSLFPDAKLVMSISSPLNDPEKVAGIIRQMRRLEAVFLMDESNVLPQVVIEALCQCPDMERLAIVQVPFSEEDWSLLARAKGVRALELESVEVTDDILMKLTQMESVEELCLTDLPLTGDAVQVLKQWRNLKSLHPYLDHEELSLGKLQAALPHVRMW